MKKLISLFWVVLLLLSMGVNSAMATLYPYVPALDCTLFGTCAVYVKQSWIIAPDYEDGTKAHPYNTIADAVNRVKTDVDFNTILLAQGTYATGLLYYPEAGFPYTFSDADTWGSSKSINIYGGYSDDFSDRDSLLYPTIIDAKGDNGIFEVENIGGNITGIEFTGVGTIGTAAIEVDITSSTNYKFTVEGNEFYDNSGLGTTGVDVAVYNSNTAVVSGNIFHDFTGQFTTVVSVLGDVEMVNNHLYFNTVLNALTCSDGAFIYNNYILGNDVYDAGIFANGDCDVLHNTVASNDVLTLGSDSAVVVMKNNGNTVANNLIASNGGNQPYAHVLGDTSTFEYNALNNSTDPVSPGSGNELCDPLFDVISFGDPTTYKLGEGSACIDKGKDVSNVSEDYFGTARAIDGDDDGNADYDPGAHEAPSPSVVAPTISGLTATPSAFSPDFDAIDDTTIVSFDVDNDADVTLSVLDSNDVLQVKLIDNVATSAGTISEVWNGEDSTATVVADGTYKVKVEVSNVGGNDIAEFSVVVDTTGLLPPSGQCAGYSDVQDTDPECAAIEYVQSIGAMTGNPNGTFDPDDYLQRDQVAKISLETFGLFDGSVDYCNSTDPFPDVSLAQWSYQYVCRGVALAMITGYLSGDDAGYYRPARSVNRVEFLALILRNLDEAMPPNASTSYNDVSSGQWYTGYAKYSYDYSLFTGNDLNPTQFTQRKEVAKVIYQLHQLGKI